MKTVERMCEIVIAICFFLCFISGILIVATGIDEVLSGGYANFSDGWLVGAFLIIVGSVVAGFFTFVVYEEVKDEKPEE